MELLRSSGGRRSRNLGAHCAHDRVSTIAHTMLFCCLVWPQPKFTFPVEGSILALVVEGPALRANAMSNASSAM
eukprot:782799-Heterocapsa_arctica.AAC.1